MKLNYSDAEKKAITKVLFDIMNADRVVDDREISFLAGFVTVFGVSRSDIQEASKLSAINSLAILRLMDRMKKKEFMDIMTSMANIDGRMSREEAAEVMTIVLEANIEL